MLAEEEMEEILEDVDVMGGHTQHFEAPRRKKTEKRSPFVGAEGRRDTWHVMWDQVWVQIIPH